jgi:hypothetical protein
MHKLAGELAGRQVGIDPSSWLKQFRVQALACVFRIGSLKAEL